nr:hypothetical protein [uncultured Carboxylicivirga sp.]
MTIDEKLVVFNLLNLMRLNQMNTVEFQSDLENLFYNSLKWNLNRRHFMTDEITNGYVKDELKEINKALSQKSKHEKNKIIRKYYSLHNKYITHHTLSLIPFLLIQIKITMREEKKQHVALPQSVSRKVSASSKNPISVIRLLVNLIRRYDKPLTKINLSRPFLRIAKGMQNEVDEKTAYLLFNALARYKKYLEENIQEKECSLDNFQRIITRRNKTEIKKYFYQLKKVGIEESDIDALLSSTFSCFPYGKMANKLIAECSQGALRHFIYYFYEMEMKAGAETQAKYYISLLQNYFEAFSNTTFKSLQGHFGDGQPSKYPFKENLVNM